jgi:asparagine synthase (glutamine-hydrolysing)
MALPLGAPDVSGFVGVVNQGGIGASREWLRQATSFMAFRGPDAQDCWLDFNVGLGQALLRTTFEAEREQQPCSLDGQVRVVADVRLDGRSDLLRRLRDGGRAVANDAPDVELLLHAYHLWGEGCLDHLMGDFAFALWDGREEKLFCARDQFGVAPFYYAEVPDGLLFSNTLNCLRLHPQVTDELNDHAVGDFLLFNMNMDPATTTFAGIQRLPPASALTWQEGGLRIRRYWSMPEWNGYLRYRRAEDYVEQFGELFTQAVADRLRTDRLSTHLSGGLDSSSIAITAQRLLADGGASFDLRAFTIIFERLIPDKEPEYVRQIEEATGLPTEYLVADDYLEADPPEHPLFMTPEPSIGPSRTADRDLMQRAAAHGRVLLIGLGGDPALMFVPTYWIEWLRSGQIRRLVQAHWQYVRLFHRRPPLYWRASMRHRRKTAERPSLPDWVNPAFAAEMNLSARQEQLQADGWAHIDRPGMAASPFWSNLFAMADPGFTSFPVKPRFPFFDLRLVRFLQAVPPVPWMVRKKLLRDAMQGVLPEAVRSRPKTPLAGDPHRALAERQGCHPSIFSLVATAPGLDSYVDRDRLTATLPSLAEMGGVTHQRVRTTLALASWLCHQDRHTSTAPVAVGTGARTPSW